MLAMSTSKVKDTVGMGMGMALQLLLWSLDQNKNNPMIQFGTVQKMRVTYSRSWHALAKSLEVSIGKQNTAKMLLTSCPMNSDWFERFRIGCHCSTGDNARQDCALLTLAMVELLNYFEELCQVMEVETSGLKSYFLHSLFGGGILRRITRQGDAVVGFGSNRTSF